MFDAPDPSGYPTSPNLPTPQSQMRDRLAQLMMGGNLQNKMPGNSPTGAAMTGSANILNGPLGAMLLQRMNPNANPGTVQFNGPRMNPSQFMAPLDLTQNGLVGNT